MAQLLSDHDCAVCDKIVGLFDNRTRDPKKSFRAQNLGSIEEVLHQSSCKLHPKLIQAALSNDPEFPEKIARARGFSAFRWDDAPRTSSQGVYIQEGNTFGSCEIFLVGPRSNDCYAAEGRVVDKEWCDTNLLVSWKDTCCKKHPKCRRSDNAYGDMSFRPAWLIDCHLNRLVPNPSDEQYVALSYVWGGPQSFMTLKENLARLQKDGAFLEPDILSKLPQTIKDAIRVTLALQERYIWIDSLCIIQDEGYDKEHQIVRMPWIYNNALLTIVAKVENAQIGLPGFRGGSTPRDLKQQTFRLKEDIWCMLAENGRGRRRLGKWDQRGWCFQENTFSKRRLVFHDQTVRWECMQGQRYEDLDIATIWPIQDFGSLQAQELCSLEIPDMERLMSAIATYNTKEFTFAKDAFWAFCGFMFALSCVFEGGFISGLPVMFFESFLLWQPFEEVERRLSQNEAHQFEPAEDVSFPSWSWLGWKGRLDTYAWIECNDYLKKHGSIISLFGSGGVRTVSLHSWSYANPGDASVHTIDNDMNVRREDFCYRGQAAPSGWTRHKFIEENTDRTVWPDPDRRPDFYFTRDDGGSAEFWYPIPRPDSVNITPEPRLIGLLKCRTRRAYLFAAEYITSFRPNIALRRGDATNEWTGCLHLHSRPPNDEQKENREHGLFGVKLELVELSAGYCNEYTKEGRRDLIDELSCEERPRYENTTRYSYYNVMWIKWHGSVAYRNGVGRVAKARWEALEREWIDLTLG